MQKGREAKEEAGAAAGREASGGGGAAQEEAGLWRLQQEAPARAAQAAVAVPPAVAAAAAAAGRLATLFAALQARESVAAICGAARFLGLRTSLLPPRLLQVTRAPLPCAPTPPRRPSFAVPPSGLLLGRAFDGEWSASCAPWDRRGLLTLPCTSSGTDGRLCPQPPARACDVALNLNAGTTHCFVPKIDFAHYLVRHRRSI